MAGNHKRQTFADCEQCGLRFGPLQNLKIRFCSKTCSYTSRKGQPGPTLGKHYPHRQRARIAICHVCRKSFRAVWEFKDKLAKYCSKECWSYCSPRISKHCKYCYEYFTSYEYQNKRYCNNYCRDKGMIGKKLSEGTKAIMSFLKKGKIPKNAWKPGPLHPHWNPNRTDYRERYIIQYKEWRRAVLRRDNYTCQICGYRGRKGLRRELHVDHILPFATHPELRTDLSNGRTLCVVCHHETETWGKKPIDDIKQGTVIKS